MNPFALQEYITDSLTGAGRREAAAIARYFASDCCEVRPTHIYTSPRGRAKATARYTEKALGMAAEVEPWTTELSNWPRLSGGAGDAAMKGAKPGEGGLAIWDTAGESPEVRTVAHTLSASNQFDEIAALQKVKAKYEDLKDCSNRFLARHGYVWEPSDDGGPGIYRIVRQNRDCILVFAHAGFGLTWLSILLGIPLMHMYTSFFLAPSSMTTILLDERSADFASPRILCLGALPHMEKERLDLQPSKYEAKNKYKEVPGAVRRVSGIKSNFF
jgi:broad specificity phosphatase PhoE